MATIKETAKKLNDNPTEENWETLAGMTKSANVKYYSVFDPTGIAGVEKRRAYAVLYDSHHKSMFRVPLYDKKGTKIKSAARFLERLVLNKKEIVSEVKKDDQKEQMVKKLRSLGYM